MPGYAEDGDWVCVDKAGPTVSVSGGNQVTLASGDKVTCTMTDNDIRPQTDQKKLRADALDLATWLDNCNNGMYCGG